MSVLPFISSAPEGFELRKLDLTGESRNAYSVSNMAAAFDGNYNTFANAAFWGAGQGIKVDLGGSKRIGMARLVSDVYAGPEWGFCIMRFGGASIKTLLADRKKEVTWEGDVMASELDITEYARTRVYTIEVWEKVPLPSTPPKVIMPVVLSPLEVATNSAVESINGGPEKADVLRNAINATASEEALQLVQAEIDYWQDLQLQDPGNGDTQGTLGYFAVSARDFWSEVGNLQDISAPLADIRNQLLIWSDYTGQQAGKPFSEMTPIDIWWSVN